MNEAATPPFRYQIRGSNRNTTDPELTANHTELRDRQLEDYLQNVKNGTGTAGGGPSGGGGAPHWGTYVYQGIASPGPGPLVPVLFDFNNDPDNLYDSGTGVFTFPQDAIVSVTINAGITWLAASDPDDTLSIAFTNTFFSDVQAQSSLSTPIDTITYLSAAQILTVDSGSTYTADFLATGPNAASASLFMCGVGILWWPRVTA